MSGKWLVLRPPEFLIRSNFVVVVWLAFRDEVAFTLPRSRYWSRVMGHVSLRFNVDASKTMLLSVSRP